MIKIFIADDHYVVRKGLKHILSSEKDIVVTAEASTAQEVLNQFELVKWDLMILDIAFPDKNGLDILIELKNRRPESKIIILSMHKEEEIAIRAFRTGADGYLNKDSIPEELVIAVRTAIKGKKYIGSTLDESVSNFVYSGSRNSPHKELSEREFQVMCLIASGSKMKEIAQNLQISVKTVCTYRTRIMEKLNFKSNVELVHYALKNKLIVN